ncbi:MAG: hypothetical protein N4A35_13550 [Flavobacteriales bacterium]|jgi:hypothetical protein|nr:hypothetical protein [Flavobacteriales bacterium]
MNKVLVVSFLVVIFLGCKKDKAIELVQVDDDNGAISLSYCDTVTVSFVNTVKPIFIQNCATSGCHNAASSASGYVFEDYAQISDSLTFNRVLKAVKHEPGVSSMPKFQAKLNDSLIQQLECWLAQGKQNN